ncbi:SusE domain-containing protein [Gracilimonas sp. Q87]|uniref:SusE domain-containing protein n=1 Tax=Gracilimonas sp. Q87 TaxID=3384766 RepID=UPI0039841064
MKKLILITSTIMFGLLFTISCEDSTGPMLKTDVDSPTIISGDGETYVLNKDVAGDSLTLLEWSESDYGFDAAVTYTVQMDPENADFDNNSIVNLGRSNTTKFTTTVKDLNAVLLGANFTPLQEINAMVRVQAVVNDQVDTMYTSPVSLNLTPYSTCNYCPAIYVPGNYQGASGYTNDWSPADAPALSSLDGLTDNYEGYVYMANANNEFKFTAVRDWSKDWGSNNGSTSELVDGDGETNATLAESGYYKMNVNINNLEYSVTKTDWGVIGDATPNGWDSDTDMTYDPVNKVWTVDINLTSGTFKFRANDAWNLDYGDNEGDGELDQGGGNISVSSAGNYIIILNLSEYPYTYSIE